MVRMIDIKTRGLSQDLSELKSNTGFAKALGSQISRIKSEGKSREDSYNKSQKAKIEKYEKLRADLSDRVYKKQGNVNSRPQGERAIKRLQSKENIERLKSKVYTAGSRIETGVSTVLERATSKIGQAMRQRIISRGIVRPEKSSITIKNNKPAEYVPVYFQAELKQAKEDMGFWK